MGDHDASLAIAVFPARAGMIPSTYAALEGMKSIPRESGDDPLLILDFLSFSRYSPRERG